MQTTPGAVEAVTDDDHRSTERRPRGRTAPAGGPLWASVAVLLGVLLWLWASARPLGSRFVNRPATLGAISSLAALTGTVLLAMTIVLTARLHLVERGAGGLDRVYRFHHRLGAAAFALLALHPSLLAWRYAHVSWDRSAALWRPDPTDLALAAGQVALYGMAVAIAATMWCSVRHQVLLWLQRALGVLFLPAAWHALHAGGDSAERGPLRWYLGAVVALGLAALVAHTFAGRLVSPHHRYEARSVRALSPTITELWLRPLGRSMHFVPGQFAFVRFKDQPIGGEPHPYSIASAPGGELRFTVKHLGDYTAHIGEVTVGAEAVVEGPYGRFSNRFVAGRRQAWVAGGIGIAPFLSMAHALEDTGGYRVTLFYGHAGDGPASVLEELRALAAHRPDLEVVLVDEHADGLIDADLLGRHLGDLADVEFLLCGPPPMLHSLQRQLTNAGVAHHRIHFEEFGF